MEIHQVNKVRSYSAYMNDITRYHYNKLYAIEKYTYSTDLNKTIY